MDNTHTNNLTTEDLTDLIRMFEISKMLGISQNQIIVATQKGLLTPIKIARRLTFYRKSELLNYFNNTTFKRNNTKKGDHKNV